MAAQKNNVLLISKFFPCDSANRVANLASLIHFRPKHGVWLGSACLESSQRWRRDSAKSLGKMIGLNSRVASRIIKHFRYLKWRYWTLKAILGVGFPLHKPYPYSFYRWGFLHFRYLKCLVTEVALIHSYGLFQFEAGSLSIYLSHIIWHFSRVYINISYACFQKRGTPNHVF